MPITGPLEAHTLAHTFNNMAGEVQTLVASLTQAQAALQIEKERAEKERLAREEQEKEWREQSKKEVEKCIRDTGGIEPLRYAENLSEEDVWEDFYGED